MSSSKKKLQKKQNHKKKSIAYKHWDFLQYSCHVKPCRAVCGGGGDEVRGKQQSSQGKVSPRVDGWTDEPCWLQFSRDCNRVRIRTSQKAHSPTAQPGTKFSTSWEYLMLSFCKLPIVSARVAPEGKMWRAQCLCEESEGGILTILTLGRRGGRALQRRQRWALPPPAAPQLLEILSNTNRKLVLHSAQTRNNTKKTVHVSLYRVEKQEVNKCSSGHGGRLKCRLKLSTRKQHDAVPRIVQSLY